MLHYIRCSFQEEFKSLGISYVGKIIEAMFKTYLFLMHKTENYEEDNFVYFDDLVSTFILPREEKKSGYY